MAVSDHGRMTRKRPAPAPNARRVSRRPPAKKKKTGRRGRALRRDLPTHRDPRSNPKPAKKRRRTTKRNHCHSWEEVRVAAYILHAFKQLTTASLKRALDDGEEFQRSDMLLRVLGAQWVVEYDGQYWHSQGGSVERFWTDSNHSLAQTVMKKP